MDETQAADVAALTRRLVAVPSHDDETRAGEAIADWFRTETDAPVRTDEVGNVIARKTPDRAADAALIGESASRDDTALDESVTGRPTLALVGHHDVVPPAPEQVAADGERFTVERRDNRLYGRGTADMKGAVAAAMCAFRATTREQLAAAGLELVVVSFVDEESGSEGCLSAVRRGFQPAYAVVCEGSTGYSAPGVTDVAVAHKGRRGTTITARGEAAHASQPAAGENAIYRASDAVETIRAASPPASDIQGQRVEGSVAVTQIDGGEAWNVIPETCTVTVDERTVPGDRLDFDPITAVDGVSLTVEQNLPPMACDDPAFADSVLAAARRVHSGGPSSDGPTNADHDASSDGPTNADHDASGDETAAGGSDDAVPAHVIKPHATDAGYLADAGATTVVCGPAEPGEAHTDTESVSLAVLDRCVRLYRAVVADAPFEPAVE